MFFGWKRASHSCKTRARSEGGLMPATPVLNANGTDIIIITYSLRKSFVKYMEDRMFSIPARLS